MDGENVDDDISILDLPSNEGDDIEVDAGSTNPIIPFSPFSNSTKVADDPLRNGAFDALKKAFTSVEERLNSSTAENRLLKKRIRRLESAAQNRQEPDSFVATGESFDMMDDARYVAVERAGGLQSPRGTPATLVGSGEGRYVTAAATTTSNARQPVMQVSSPPRNEGEYRGHDQYRENSPDKNQALSSLNYQVAVLRQENSRLQQGWETERREKETVVQELREKCCSLQSERDKALKEGASLLASLQKANQEVSILKERQEERSLNSMTEPPPDLLKEMVHMRQVIDKLKTMVLWQKDCLMSRSMSMSHASLNRSPHPTPITHPHSLEEAHSPSPSPPQASSAGGANSSNSWEMVLTNNGVAPLVTTTTTTTTTNAVTADPHLQHLLQQRSAKMMGVQLAAPRMTSNTNFNNASAFVTTNPAISANNAAGGGGKILGKPVAPSGSNNFAPNSQGTAAVSRNTAAATTTPTTGRIASPRQQQVGGATPQMPKAQTEVMYRRHSEVDVTQARGKIVEAPATQPRKAHTLPQQTPASSSSSSSDACLADWMGNHYQQRAQQGVVVGGGVGLNQFMRDGVGVEASSAGITVPGQMIGSPSRVAQPEGQYVELPLGANYSQPGASYAQPGSNYSQPGSNYSRPGVNYPQRQASPPTGLYDNVGSTGGTSTTSGTAASGGTIVLPGSMHILNQSSMTGGRVLQNNSGGFANAAATGGGEINATTAPNSQPPVPVNNNNGGGGGGGNFRPSPSPQENARAPARGRGPTDLDLNPEIQFVNELPPAAAGTESGNVDRKCPVCSQDFQNITMDEFQTHVFECFDDSEDTSAETMRPPPHGNQVQGQSSVDGRVCPMCEKSFVATVNQEFFESHVQSHFEDVVNHFEVLDIHQG